ncbi:MAG: Uma2 family endonuclease [Bryobacter sp.]|nr:Uma2 family endonuclease [Bryobacter sp.]
MNTAVLVPVEEYLRYTGKPYREYREGRVEEKAMPTVLHGLLAWALVTLLRRAGLAASLEVRVPVGSNKYLIPDVLADAHLPEAYPTKPVLLCCEVLSPEDGLGQMLSKCEEYHAWGVPYCWVVDPVRRSAWQYAKGGEPEKATVALEAGSVRVSLPELFSILDEGKQAGDADAPGATPQPGEPTKKAE